MKKALNKDVLRTIRKEKKRFFSIMVITILGVVVMTGISAGCKDLRKSADIFFDAQKLFDVSVLSTLGLTDEDVNALQTIEGVEKAEGAFSEIVHTKRNQVNQTAEIKGIKEDGLNIPHIVEGTLPQEKNEIAVTQNYITDTGKKIGDIVEIEEISNDEEDVKNFPITSYVITGIVVDVMDINNAQGSAGFRATPNADYTFFIPFESIESEVYTAVYLSVEDTAEILCYSSEYENRVANVASVIETEIMEQREAARYEEVTQEAYDEIADAEKEMNEEFAKAEKEIADAETDLEEGKTELSDGKKELEEKEAEVAKEIADARAEIAKGYTEIEDAEKQVTDGWGAIAIAENDLVQGRNQLLLQQEQVNKQIAEGKEKVNQAINENQENARLIDAQILNLQTLFGEEWTKEGGLGTDFDAYVSAAEVVLLPIMQTYIANGQKESQEELQQKIMAALNQDANFIAAQNTFMGKVMLLLPPGTDPTQMLTQMSALAIQKAQVNATATILATSLQEITTKEEEAKKQFEAGFQQISDGETQIYQEKVNLVSAENEIKQNRQKLNDAVKELDENEQKANTEFADARQELADAEVEIADGEKELQDNIDTFETEKADAIKEIEDAKKEVADIDMTQWYIQDRTSLSGYVNVKSDADCIESLATVFSVVFFIVAILISLTTVTRMVEEERGLIGTYKALGFNHREIRKKYISYALFAGVFGGILGSIGGFVILPEILFIFFDVMYMLPKYYIQFEAITGGISVLLFVAGICGAAYVACFAELKHSPAELMRPKAPKMGSRVFLEYITPIWKRMSFLNKVTVRNLFRYKKRLLMTVLGIAGCTALLVFGFAIKDSVSELMPLQYEDLYDYDLLAVTSGSDNDKLMEYVKNSEEISEFINIQVESVKIKNKDGRTEKVQLMIFPDEAAIDAYLNLEDMDGTPVDLQGDGLYLTVNAIRMLKLNKGEKLSVQKLNLEQETLVLTESIMNYMGNNAYLTKAAYEKAFGTYEPNAVLANYSEVCTDPIGYADTLGEEDWILSSMSKQELKDGFSAAFTLINIVVYVVLILAAGLAFAVLYTLANVNISERERELATIKVLGFFDREVHSYVNKESIILTMIGIIIGLPVGAAMSMTLTDILNMPAIYFAINIYPRSYLFSAGLALLFAIMVQFLTDRTLNAIAPAEALKSVE